MEILADKRDSGSATLRASEHTAPVPPRLDYTARELLSLPRDERRRIAEAQAALAAPMYEADLALPAHERELTAFESLNDYDPIHEGASQ